MLALLLREFTADDESINSKYTVLNFVNCHAFSIRNNSLILAETYYSCGQEFCKESRRYFFNTAEIFF